MSARITRAVALIVVAAALLNLVGCSARTGNNYADPTEAAYAYSQAVLAGDADTVEALVGERLSIAAITRLRELHFDIEEPVTGARVVLTPTSIETADATFGVDSVVLPDGTTQYPFEGGTPPIYSPIGLVNDHGWHVVIPPGLPD